MRSYSEERKDEDTKMQSVLLTKHVEERKNEDTMEQIFF